MGDGLTPGYDPFLRGGCIHERGSDDAAHPRMTMRQIVFFNTILSSKRFQGDLKAAVAIKFQQNLKI